MSLNVGVPVFFLSPQKWRSNSGSKQSKRRILKKSVEVIIPTQTLEATRPPPPSVSTPMLVHLCNWKWPLDFLGHCARNAHRFNHYPIIRYWNPISSALHIAIQRSITFVGETVARSAMRHILPAGFSLTPSSVGTLLLREIYFSLLGMVWYYQRFRIPMTKFAKIRKVCFCYGILIFVEWTKCCFTTV